MTHVATLVCDPAPLTPDDALLAPVAQRLQAERTEWLTELAADIFFAAPHNEYTRRLLAAIPVVTDEEARFCDRFRSPEVDVEEAED